MNKRDFAYGRPIKLRDYRVGLTRNISRTMWRILQKSDVYIVAYHEPEPNKRYSMVDFVCRLENGAFSDQIWTADTRLIATLENFEKESKYHYPIGDYLI